MVNYIRASCNINYEKSKFNLYNIPIFLENYLGSEFKLNYNKKSLKCSYNINLRKI